ncbi:serine-rich adhesin for platelets isoform X2 [Labrus bergylta]|uniref:serine-rich adhesin for platelets isoform X2 n=1 Tax=Labrus bergylta TaxID=56723 RepID=UPI00331433EF
MANETTVQTSSIEENHNADDDWENIPPEISTAAESSELGDVVGYSSTQPSGGSPPLSDVCAFSTPAPTSSSDGGGKAKSRLSGLQSALTPILKYLNINNKCRSPVSSKQGNANSQKPNDSSNRLLHPDFLSSHCGPSLVGTHASVSLLEDEYLPEITLLDVTCDSTMQVTRNDSALPDSVPPSPVTARPVCSPLTAHRPSKLTASTSLNTSTPMPDVKMHDPLESSFAPLRWLDDRYFPEITLLDVTRDSEPSPGAERSSMNITQDISPAEASESNAASTDLGGQIAAQPATVDVSQSVDLSNTLEGNVTHTSSSLSEPSKCGVRNGTKASFELTRDISVSNASESSRLSTEPSGQNMMDAHTAAEDTLETHPVNVTRDLSSSSDTSVQSAVTQFSTSDMQCDSSSKTVTSELHREPVVTSNARELHTSHDARASSLSPKTAGSANDTFTVAQSANRSSSSSLSGVAQTPQNKTLDLPPSNVNSPRAESEAKGQASSLSSNTTENSLVVSCSAVKTNVSCDMPNATFDRNSLQKSSGNSTLGEAAAGTFCLQNNTFDTKPPPQQNYTITLSETSDSLHNSMDKPSSSKVCDATSSPKNPTPEPQPPETSEQTGSKAGTDPNAKVAGVPESTFEVDPVVEKASSESKCGIKDISQSGQPMTDSPSDTSAYQSRDLDGSKGNTFNLDDTLDLAAAALITSTPMPNCKVFNFNNERETGKILGATKKLYGDVPSKPDCQVTSDIPSNIVCDRKTFLTKPAARSLLPPSKSTSHLLKYKPASTLPERFEPLMSGMQMKRQKMQTEALRSSAASDAPQVTTGISSAYNLRATTTGSKKPNYGLRKPQAVGMPSGVQRAAAGLRPPSTRSKAPASPTSSGTEKLRAPAEISPATKISLAKKHPLSRAEALQVAAKRRKMDAPLPSSNAEASTSSCGAANRAKNLKQPTTSQRPLPAKTQREDAAAQTGTAETSTSCDAASRARVLKQPGTSHRAPLAKPQAHGCANCVALEQQLKMKSEEIRRLKEELLKYHKEEEEC